MDSAIQKGNAIAMAIEQTYAVKWNSLKAGDIPIGVFSGDEHLTNAMESVKTAAKHLSGSCTKLTMISTESRNEKNIAEAIKSIGAELETNITTLFVTFMMTLHSQMCWPLYQQLTSDVREMITNVLGLAELVHINETDNQVLRNAAGMVWKSCENIEKLPSSNKLSYRRDMMLKIADVKDTIREFTSYVEQYDTRLLEGRLRYPGNAAYDDEDNEEGEEDYTADEVKMVRRCLMLFTYIKEVMICGLKALTCVGDSLRVDDVDTHDDEHTVYEDEGNTAKRTWIAQCSLDTKALLDSFTNAGAELYPAIDPDEVNIKYESTRSLALLYLASLSSPYGVVLTSELATKIAELSTSSIATTVFDFTGDISD